ncbi:MAG: competence/damage-inducible protein A [Caldisericaceae bacterium]
MSIGIIIVGNEVLSGSRHDANTPCFIELLKRKNLELSFLLTVPDRIECIEKSLLFLANEVDFLVVSGGLGLTPDDVTLNAVSRATGINLVYNPHKEDVVKSNLSNYPNSKYNLYIKRLSIGLENSNPIPNSCGIAAGEHFVFKGCTIFVLPGVPEEFQRMLENYVLDCLPAGIPRETVSYRTTAKESELIDFLENVEKEYRVKTSSYPPVLGEKLLKVGFEGSDEELKQVCFLFEKFLKAKNLFFEKVSS